jgi:hypothetical protein
MWVNRVDKVHRVKNRGDGEALSMGWCLAIIQIALLWTIVGKMLTENHAPGEVANTSFVV